MTGSRWNANGVDLNADGGTRDEPETNALMAFGARIRPSLTVYVHSPNGMVGWFGAGEPSAQAWTIAIETSHRCGAPMGFDVAGTRADPTTWFLWQGTQEAGGGAAALLVELHAIADQEVPKAIPRPPTQAVATVDCEARQILAILDR